MGVVRVLPDRLSGLARALLATSLLYMQAHLASRRFLRGSWTSRWCVEAEHHAPLDNVGSAYETSSNHLQQARRTTRCGLVQGCSRHNILRTCQPYLPSNRWSFIQGNCTAQ